MKILSDGPTFAKKLLKQFAISKGWVIFIPSTEKGSGKSCLFFIFPMIFFIVAQVCLMFDLFFSNCSA